MTNRPTGRFVIERELCAATGRPLVREGHTVVWIFDLLCFDLA
jgi:hypothetical protein